MKHRTTPEAYRLLHDGTLALAEIEANGVRVDMNYLESALDRSAKQIQSLVKKMEADEVYKVWKKFYGNKIKLGNREQLADIIFNKMGYESRKKPTATGRHQAGKAALEHVDLQFVRDYIQAEGIKKARSTYLRGIHSAAVPHGRDWFIHPNYNLNLASSFRSTCDDPNFQNNPIRNPEIAALVRPAYIPRRGCDFHEPDLSQAEVRVAACYNHDPVLIKYLKDKSTDMHRDTACKIFLLKKEQVDKKTARDSSKNQFVFPNFYGAAYFTCALEIWEAMARRKMCVAGSDVTLQEHLRTKGITGLGECDPDLIRQQGGTKAGTFVHHVKKVAEWFWNDTFTVYTQWKKDWVEAYMRNGGMMMLTGFAVGTFGRKGPLAPNDIINYPIQGAAFHILLWCLIRILKLLKKYKMKTKIVGEIHDSFQSDTPHRERDAFIDIAMKVMTVDVCKHWDWIIVPLEAEVDVAPEGYSWNDKQPFSRRPGGGWGPADLEKWQEKFGPWSAKA